MKKRKYVKKINELMEQCENLKLLDFIYKFLLKTIKN